MSPSRPSVDDAASIKAFLSTISSPGKKSNVAPAIESEGDITIAQASTSEGPVNGITELNIDETKTTEVENKASEDALSGSAVSPSLAPESIRDWVHENAPSDHFKTKNPLIEAVQAQDSPKATGVLAPPPTPETLSNLAIGKIMSDELDKIPEDRMLSLNDSKWASSSRKVSFQPDKFDSRPLASSEQFLSAIPQSNKARDDQNFTRMSFQAADSPVQAIGSNTSKSAGKKPLSPRAPEWTPGALNGTTPNGHLDGKATNGHVGDTVKETAKLRDPSLQPKTTDDIFSHKPLLTFENSASAFDPSECPGGILTPSSVTFGPASPTNVRAAGIEAAKAKAGDPADENLEDALYFKAWPKVEERAARTAARVRKVILTGIPVGSTPTDVASLVYGGSLESIAVGSSTGFATFLRAEDADKFYESTGNGIVYKAQATDAREHVIMTQMSREVNPVSGVLRECIEKGYTRCVRAVGVDTSWTMGFLHEAAGRKKRKIEKIVDGPMVNNVSADGYRVAVVRTTDEKVS
ncbi:MAG: hypothetical protein Q9174_000036 [Haloplaca sp. 1 TL-2023]